MTTEETAARSRQSQEVGCSTSHRSTYNASVLIDISIDDRNAKIRERPASVVAATAGGLDSAHIHYIDHNGGIAPLRSKWRLTQTAAQILP
jgi:hypothetical protein